MKLSKVAASLLTAGTLSLASGAASALTVSGVTWDPNSPFDFIAQTSLIETVATTAGQTITGYGIINFFNLESQDTFCPTCELTFKFSNYVLANSITGTVGESFDFTGGQLEVYVGPRNFSQTNAATATDGTLFLSLVGVDVTGDGFTLSGTLTTATTQGAQIAGQGSGSLNVTGGVASAYFDTNGQPGGADIVYTSSFQPLATAIVSGGVTYTHGGTTEITGNTVAVPEPGVLALLGIGLVGIGLGRRAKKAA